MPVTTGPGGATGAALAARPEAPAPPRVPAPVPVSGPERTGRRSPGGGVLANAATLAGLLVLFFSVPVRAGQSPGALVRSSAIAAAGVAMVAWVVVRQVRGSGRRELTPLQLVLLAEIVAIVFALVYYSLALAGDNFVGVRTRLDALYFTLTTMTTVGYGDVRPTSQLARGVVSAHLVFNLVFLGTLARLLQRRVAERRR